MLKFGGCTWQLLADKHLVGIWLGAPSSLNTEELAVKLGAWATMVGSSSPDPLSYRNPTSKKTISLSNADPHFGPLQAP